MKNKILCLLRHAAYAQSTMALTEAGIADIYALCRKLPAYNLHPDVIYHSRVLRAEQSAAYVREALREAHGAGPDVLPCAAFDEVSSSNDQACNKAMLEAVRHFPDAFDTILVVSHLPNIAMLNRSFQCGLSSFEKADLVALDLGAISWNHVQVQTGPSGHPMSSIVAVRNGITHISSKTVEPATEGA